MNNINCLKLTSYIVTLSVAFIITMGTVPPTEAAATITVVNLDDAGEGFNDPAAPDPDSTAGGNFGATLGAQRLLAFQHAASLWGGELESSVEVSVGARFDPQTCTATRTILGSARPVNYFRDFTGAPQPSTWYPVALANKLRGQDLDPAQDDIAATFNSAVGTTCPFPSVWYYGLNANPPGEKIDFITVVSHELAHGLGFLTIVDLATGAKPNNFDDAFMLHLENHNTGEAYPNMTNDERVIASTSDGNLDWIGDLVIRNSTHLSAGRLTPSGHVRMFAPNPAQPGSSVSHFDTVLAPDEQQEPSYTSVDHTVGLSRSLLCDIGWCVNIAVVPQTLEMGKVVQTKTADKWLTIENNLSKDLNFTTTPSDASLVNVSPTNGHISPRDQPEDQTTLKVTLAPTVDTPIGLYSSTLTISDADDKTNPSKSVTINAEIIKAEPKISISRIALNLGKVVQTHSKDSNLIINNPGELPLTFNISSSNSLVSVTPTEGTINPAKELKVKVTFKPTQQTPAVPSNYTLSITHNASSPTSPLTIPVTATVAALTPPEIVVKPMELDFGSVAPQTTKKLIIYIDNEGTADTVITASTKGKKTPDSKPKPNDPHFKFLDNNGKIVDTTTLKVPGKDPLPLTVVFLAGKMSETTSISGIATITYKGSDKTILIPLTANVVLQGFSLYLFFIPIAFLMIWLWLPRPWWDRIRAWVTRRFE